jgi:hypothetical protein
MRTGIIKDSTVPIKALVLRVILAKTRKFLVALQPHSVRERIPFRYKLDMNN